MTAVAAAAPTRLQSDRAVSSLSRERATANNSAVRLARFFAPRSARALPRIPPFLRYFVSSQAPAARLGRSSSTAPTTHLLFTGSANSWPFSTCTALREYRFDIIEACRPQCPADVQLQKSAELASDCNTLAKAGSRLRGRKSRQLNDAAASAEAALRVLALTPLQLQP